jgi:hypothetical protein
MTGLGRSVHMVETLQLIAKSFLAKKSFVKLGAGNFSDIAIECSIGERCDNANLSENLIS